MNNGNWDTKSRSSIIRQYKEKHAKKRLNKQDISMIQNFADNSISMKMI